MNISGTINMIPHSRPLITSGDIESVEAVLRSGQIAGGETAQMFERELAAYIGRPRAVAVSCGTAAIYTVLSAMGIRCGHRVVIPAYVCASLLYAVRMTGAEPVAADSGDDLFHMSADTVKRALGAGVKAVIFPHMFGSASDISDILALGVPVIEDCALSLGAELNGVRTGNMGSVASVFSFYATKVIAAGEGGMVASDDAALIDSIRDMTHYADKPDGLMRFNFAMNGMSAALGRSQLKRLEAMITRRRELAARYTERLKKTNLTLPEEKPHERHIFYRYVVGTDRIEKLRRKLLAYGVTAERPVYCPLSRYPGIDAECPHAEEAWRTSLSVPLYPALTDDESDTVIDAVIESEATLD